MVTRTETRTADTAGKYRYYDVAYSARQRLGVMPWGRMNRRLYAVAGMTYKTGDDLYRGGSIMWQKHRFGGLWRYAA
jgi:hypothetical protein